MLNLSLRTSVRNQLLFFTELAKSTLLENQGAEKIVKKLEVLEKSFDENSDNKLELAACGSMLNVASDDGIYSHC